MKAVQIANYAENFDIRITTEVPVPKPDAEQVQVWVYAAAVNPFDVTIAKGLAQQMIKLELPATIGGDFAGVIMELGNEVTDFKVGDEVYGQARFTQGKGAFAEIAVADSQSIGLKPQSISFDKAAALPLTAVSAYQALVERIQLKPSQKILIHGGAGGIGTIAIQLAKHLGAHVATTAAANELEYVKQLGADEAIDYKNQKFDEILSSYDAVFDTVGNETYRRSFKILKPGGMIVSMVQPPDEALMAQYNVESILQSSKVNRDRLSEVAKLVDSGATRAHVDRVFGLDQTAEALEYLKSGHPKGKVVINIKSSDPSSTESVVG